MKKALSRTLGWYSSFAGYYNKEEGKKEPFNYIQNRKMLNVIR